VTTEAKQAPGGTIQVTAHTLVHLRDSAITTSVRGGDARAGNITIDPESVILENSQVIANAVGGPGGNITITAGVFLADLTSRVEASSERNIDGVIDIRAAVTNISGIMVPLPQDFVPTPVLLGHQCAARLRASTLSSFVARQRDGVPATPEGLLPSRRYEAGPSPTMPATAETLQREATARRVGEWHRDATGQLQARGWLTLADTPPAWELKCAPN
jgi:hypothetical protein